MMRHGDAGIVGADGNPPVRETNNVITRRVTG
jgi:hypothetical protein